jgi:hypothetical protein
MTEFVQKVFNHIQNYITNNLLPILIYLNQISYFDVLIFSSIFILIIYYFNMKSDIINLKSDVIKLYEYKYLELYRELAQSNKRWFDEKNQKELFKSKYDEIMKKYKNLTTGDETKTF